jgi:hypothetical protein
MARGAASGIDVAELRASYEAIPYLVEMELAHAQGVWPALGIDGVASVPNAIRTPT